MDWKAFIGIAGVVVGWMLSIVTRHFEEVWFGAKLRIDCKGVPGNTDQNLQDAYVRFRVQNTTDRRIAKSCRAYLVALHKFSNNKEVSENLISDTFQLPWAGYDYEPRDIPAKVNLYIDLVHFSKQAPGWAFATKPPFHHSLGPIANHRGTYRCTVVVAGHGVTPQTKNIYIDYDGDWKSAAPYE